MGHRATISEARLGTLARILLPPTPTFHTSDMIFFHCNQKGRKKVGYPRLIVAATSVMTLAPLAMQITDGRQGKTEAPVVRSLPIDYR